MSDAVRATVHLAGTDRPLYEDYDLALLDLDGVVYIGPDAVPGAAEVLDVVRAKGLVLRFVTNNASRPPEVVSEHLNRLGIPAEPGEVVTSAQVAAALLAQRLPAGSGVLVVGAEGLRRALGDEGLVPMSSVDQGPVAVVQGFGPDVGWRLLAEAARGVRAGLYWMATNLDLTVPTAHGPAPGNGSLVRAVEVAAGRGPDDVAGKPRPGAFLEATRRAGATRPLVVGDRLDTDLEGAQAAGMPGLLVLTGVTGVTELLAAPPRLRPDFVGRDLGCLLEPHPAAVAEVDGDHVTGRCREARARVEARGSGLAVSVDVAGDDAVDLLRAAAVAVWSAESAGIPAGAAGAAGGAVDPGGLLGALRHAEPAAAWAR